jgi:hypothetical protein
MKKITHRADLILTGHLLTTFFRLVSEFATGRETFVERDSIDFLDESKVP